MSRFQSIESEAAARGTTIIGVEDSDGQPWCLDCAHGEIQRAGHAAFDMDLIEKGNRRVKCSQCGRGVYAVYRANHGR